MLSRHVGSVVVAQGLSCSKACGIFQDQGWKMCPPALAGGFFGSAWTVAHQAPLSMRFSRRGASCHFLLQGIFPTLGLKG